MTKQLALLTLKMRDQRLEILKDNEENLKEEGKESDEDDEDDGDEIVDDEEGESEAHAGFGKGRKKQEEENEDIVDSEEDDDDSDYEYTGGDLAIYDSALDDVDELTFVKETMERINAADAGYLNRMLSGMTPEELAKFNENMQGAQALKDREEVVRKQCDEMLEKKKFK